MKVLLIDPPFYRIIGFYNRYFPYGLVAVGTSLQNAGHEVMIYDVDWNEKSESIDYSLLPKKYSEYLNSFNNPNFSLWLEIRRIIKEFNPDIIGISIWTTYAAASFYVAKLAKEIFPDRMIIMGGPHATAKAEEILNICKEVDYVIRGEGEVAFLELIEYLSDSQKKIIDIKGLSYRENSKIINNPERPLTKDLDVFPLINRSLLMNEKRYTSEDMGLIMTSRGCPYSCTFCSTNTKNVSYRSTENIIAEIKSIKNRYGTTQFSIKDDSFTVNKNKVINFCQELISQKIRINWQCNTRLNLVDEDLLKLMKKAGCNSIAVGVESGSDKILKFINKGLTKEDIRQGIKIIKKSGIHCTGYFLIGVPGETESDIESTVEFMYELQTDFVSIGVYEPFPGTVMFEDGIKRGLIKPEMSLKDFFLILPNNYYKYNPDRQVDTIDPDVFYEIEKSVKNKIVKYNKNYIRIYKMGKARLKTYIHNPLLLFNDFKKFLSYN